ncbi:hypothetical protein BC940DRAFT_306120 [Gongronella butleri]|nr:hypothetical protein BC940DRAFT_306120 [Gongronella butleri]
MLQHHLVALFALSLSGALADKMPARFLQGCVYASKQNQIICHGGSTAAADPIKQFNPQSDLFSVNLTANASPNAVTTGWQPISSPDFALEARAEFAMAAMNGSRIIISSGAGPTTNYNSSGLHNVTFYYDTVSNEFGTYASSAIPVGFHNGSQFISAPVVAPLTQLQGVSSCQGSVAGEPDPMMVLSGGVRLDNWKLFNGTGNMSNFISVMPNDPNWNQVQIADIEEAATSNYRRFRDVVVCMVDGGIFSLGGFRYWPNDQATYGSFRGEDAAIAANFEDLDFVGVLNGTFSSRLMNGSVAPSFRHWFTATLIPSTNQVIMYGGYFNSTVCKDYAYIFDVTKYTWEEVKFPQMNNCSAGVVSCGAARFGHSAVLVNDLLYIMFGADANFQLLNSTIVLNVTSLLWLQADATTTVGTSAAPDSSSSSNYLSGGAIAGIVVGILVAIALIGGAIFFVRRKRAPSIPRAPSFFDENHTAPLDPLDPHGTIKPTLGEHHEAIKPTGDSDDDATKPAGDSSDDGNSTKRAKAAAEHFRVKPTTASRRDDMVKPFSNSS